MSALGQAATRWMARRWRSTGPLVALVPLVPLLLVAVVLAAPAAPGLAAGPAAGAAAPASFQVVAVGWDGTVVAGTWSPVRVRVTGGEVDTTARLEVVLKRRLQFGFGGPGPQPTPVERPVVAYGEDVALPAGVTKDVALWVPADTGMGGTVRLTAGGQTLAEQAVDFRGGRSPVWPLVGVLADSPAVARGVAQVELPLQGLPVPVSTARLTAADIPQLAERLSALSALVVQGSAAAALTGEQRRAVHEWVSGGGHLLLAGGQDAARTSAVLPPGALPLTFAGSDPAADLTPLARWAGARGPALPAGPAGRFSAATGAALAGGPDRPLAWRQGVGAGSVTLLAVDPGLEPLVSWPGTPALLRQALEPALPAGDSEKMMYRPRVQDRNSAQRLQGAVEALPPDAFPSVSTVGLVMAGFALAAGPALHLLLRRLDRREWAWIAVPATAALASAAMYGAGVGWGGRDVMVNIVSHVRLDPVAGTARQSLAAGFFAPTHADLTVTVPGDAPVRANIGDSAGHFGPDVPSSSSTEPPVRVATGRTTRVEFGGGQWTMRSVLLTRALEVDTGKITARLGLDGDLIRGTLRNDTPYVLEDAAVVVGQALVKLGTLAPGQTVPVVLDPGPPPNPMQGQPPLAMRLFGRPPDGSAGAGMAFGRSSVAYPRPMPAAPPSMAAVAVAPVATPTVVRPPDVDQHEPGAPVEPAATSIPPPAAMTGVAAVAPGGASGRVAPVPHRGMHENFDVPREPETQRRVRLLDAAVEVAHHGPGHTSVPLTFFAFTRATLGTGLPSAGRHPTYSLTVVEQPLRLELPAGRFTMPAGLIPSEMIDQTTTNLGGGSNGTVFWTEVNGGSISYAYRPPLPAGAEVSALTITTQQVGATVPASQGRGAPPAPFAGDPSPAEPRVFFLYNWRSATWEATPGGYQAVRVEPAAPYVGPDGEVRVQVNAGEGRLVRFVLPELTMEGVVTP